MTFPVDQFMQVKCKLVLTSDTDSDSIQPENERIRLCTYVHDKNCTLIIMICSNHVSNNNILTYYLEKRTRSIPKPKIKQIFYHHYNEDIVALGLSENGNKLAMISSSSTIYLLPIKNILLRPSSQFKSMYFYDATILNCCTVENPISIVYWENNQNRSTIIVAGSRGKISFINVEEKKEFNITNVNEHIIEMVLIKDMCSYSLLITCDNFKQYRYMLEIVDNQDNQRFISTDEYICLEKDMLPTWDRKPIPIKLQNSNPISSGSGSSSGAAAAAVIHRVLVPSGRTGRHTSLFTGRERSVPLIFYHSVPGIVSVVDILGSHKQRQSSSTSSNNQLSPKGGTLSQSNMPEPRLLRFFSSKQFYYRPQKPTLVSKLSSLEPDERITHLVLTDRFLAIATNTDRCLINSRNCCNSRNLNTTIELDPLVKEVTFTNDEKILLLIKSPISNDQDNIIDSFLLITSKSIYSIEARQSCRDMYINLIDSHLGIKPPRVKKITSPENLIQKVNNPHEYILIDDYRAQRKYSESNLMVSNFLCHRDEVYERINYDSKAFSILFKLELNSLYEAYGDKLMLRGQYDLANRFFQMAKFDHTKTLGKYIRLGALKETIDYVTNLLTDENEILDEKERIDLARAAFDCLLAKTIIERSKIILYHRKIDRSTLDVLNNYLEKRSIISKNSPNKSSDLNQSRRSSYSNVFQQIDMYQLCEHSPRGNVAKLSGNTIIDGGFGITTNTDSNKDNNNSSFNDEEVDDEEATMTNNNLKFNRDKRLECEKALISFVTRLMPSSLYSYVMTQLVDFGLIDLADFIARSDLRIHTLTRILLRSKEENRILFRDGRFDNLVDKLESCNYKDLIRIDSSQPKFLEFIISPEVTKAIVKDINLTSEYLGYQNTLVQFRKYSYTALRQLESFRKFVVCRQNNQKMINNSECNFTKQKIFTKQQKKSIEFIFIEFLKASLVESTEDSCKLWYNYINFYLNYVGNVEELEIDILNLLENSFKDCLFAITLYIAIRRDETNSKRPFISEGVKSTPLESMNTLYNLSKLFDNEFLMKLLEKTLDLVPQSWYEVNNFSHLLVLQ